MAAKTKIVRTESLSTDRIDGNVDDDIITCPICMNIIWKPVTCRPNTCPFRCQFQERKPSPILMKLLSKLKLTCQYKPNGCMLLIPYESLEKHELSECLFRLTQCSECSKEMLYNELENHQSNDCSPKELTCLKCNSVYYRKDGHETTDCLKKQKEKIHEIAHSYDIKDSARTSRCCQKIVELYKRQEANLDYAQRNRSHGEEHDWTPSAPVYEPSSPAHPQATSPNIVDPINTPLRLSSVNFSLIHQKHKDGAHIPNGYAGFNWENIYYMFEQHARENIQLRGFLTAYNDSRCCVAYNGRGHAILIYLPNASNTFGIHSFEAMSVYHDEFQLKVSGYRSNVLLAVKNIILKRGELNLFEINWDRIDRLVLTPERILGTNKPETFILANLNFVL
ncbi:unnamed protein product [Adineta ricciae]|uniref:TRAF-type domain-containing protein n=1 Tax=Adineta ricciae TaxID=249248 RepID=A0A816CC11_ADIRI|nr:unnamed protein product [Adineta ricciae]CAF1620876.1 unnamed protein product [Adineta ricciae]